MRIPEAWSAPSALHHVRRCIPAVVPSTDHIQTDDSVTSQGCEGCITGGGLSTSRTAAMEGEHMAYTKYGRTGEQNNRYFCICLMTVFHFELDLADSQINMS